MTYGEVYLIHRESRKQPRSKLRPAFGCWDRDPGVTQSTNIYEVLTVFQALCVLGIH